jgi:hypothetical protein
MHFGFQLFKAEKLKTVPLYPARPPHESPHAGKEPNAD